MAVIVLVYYCLDAFAFCCKLGLMLEPSHITVLITHNNKTGGFCRILTGLFNSIRKNISFFFTPNLVASFVPITCLSCPAYY